MRTHYLKPGPLMSLGMRPKLAVQAEFVPNRAFYLPLHSGRQLTFLAVAVILQLPSYCRYLSLSCIDYCRWRNGYRPLEALGSSSHQTA